MSQELFPSGLWTGFYNYYPGDRHRMELSLKFDQGVVTGDGVDDVGAFGIRGRYEPATLECCWTKSYYGKHDVFYKGFREGKGIWGTWEIQVLCRGGFHIWPKTAGTAGAAVKREQEQTQAVGFELAPAGGDSTDAHNS